MSPVGPVWAHFSAESAEKHAQTEHAGGFGRREAA
jgi:hypothetical protein